jgi:cytochrome P450
MADRMRRAPVRHLPVPLDLTDPAFVADPYPTLKALREAGPVHWYEPSQQWLLTRHRDIHAALRDRRLGRVYSHRYGHDEFGRSAPDPRWAHFHESEATSLLNLEPPDHTRIRALITKVFTPSAVAAQRPLIEQLSGAWFDRCAEAGRFDLIAGYAQPYSVGVICSMLGVPADDAPHLLAWSHAIVKMYELTTTDEQKVAANEAAREFVDYVRSLVADKRRRPDDGLVSQLVAVEEAGDRLTEDEIVCTTIVLLNAGHEATVNSLGNGMRAFLLHPDEWRKVVSGEVTPRVAVEEMVRWDAPLMLFERWVLEDGIEIGGVPLALGDEIAMLFGSAHHDPERWVDPDRFDAGRGDSGHVGFGGGAHFCVGAPLARLELEVSLSELARRFPDATLAAEPRYHPTFVIRGLQALELTV